MTCEKCGQPDVTTVQKDKFGQELCYPCLVGLLEERIVRHVESLAKIDGVLNDVEADNTDFAHPAWWRGYEQGVVVLCQMINKILDGRDIGRGGMAREPWHSTRQRLIQLRDTHRVG